MTESAEFREAFVAFRAMPYPDYPALEELRDWNSVLLDLDGHIAGYATQVYDGRLEAARVPETDALVRKLGSLRRDLEEIRPRQDEDAALLDEYRRYTAALDRLVRALASLAHR
ncbi:MULTISPECIES: hypothetical protein [unclassified Streptomyces]|uniref:hypothetical protein n=2 Tax=Streptomyces TaxID=1883 RepID=UPI003D74661D